MRKMDCEHCDKDLYSDTCDHLFCEKQLCIHRTSSPEDGMSYCSKEHHYEMWAVLHPHSNKREKMEQEKPNRLHALILKAKEFAAEAESR